MSEMELKTTNYVLATAEIGPKGHTAVLRFGGEAGAWSLAAAEDIDEMIDWLDQVRNKMRDFPNED